MNMASSNGSSMSVGSNQVEAKQKHTGKDVPVEVRRELWKESLGVSKKPDVISTWSGPLDSEAQDSIHSDCVRVAGNVRESDSVAPGNAAVVMEEVIAYYLKSRNVKYPDDPSHCELLLPLVSLGFTKGDIYNCFYTLLSKYIPRDCRGGAPAFHLFRLLLLYHEPGLCSFLDTHKLAPEEYLQPWLRSLFASCCQLDVTMTLWDTYLSEKDPFLIFFMGLVMTINAKELLEESSSLDLSHFKEIIQTLPSQLGVDDVEDFCALARYFSSQTPQSFRKDYHTVLFGQTRGSVPSLPVSHALCLPVSLGEVLDSLQPQEHAVGGVKYNVVDSRPISHYSKGHLPSSLHLDATLLLHSPTHFMVAAKRMCERAKHEGGEEGGHLCFLGTGREQEDQYVNMVIAKFLQTNVAYVSVAQGGFVELLSLLGKKAAEVLEDFEEDGLKALYARAEGEDLEPTTSSREHTPVRSDSDSETSQRGTWVPSQFQQKGAQLYASLASGMKGSSQRLKTTFGKLLTDRKKLERHVSSHDKLGKRYRNVPNVFSIADEDDDHDIGGASSSEDEGINRMVNIDSYIRGEEVLAAFPCSELQQEGYTTPSHLVLLEDHLVVLRECSDRTGWARVKARHSLSSIVKITMKKKQPDVITFKLGSTAAEEVVVTGIQRFKIPQTSKAVSAIKDQLMKKEQDGKDVNASPSASPTRPHE